jgi:AraC-like DNA-binding protein
VSAFLNKGVFSPIDSRLQQALAKIEPGTGPAELAQVIGLSTTRLRELTVHDFGVPTAKLLQWLHLQHAIEALRQSRSLADAAAAGGFSDQAHFTRRLVEWFGVTPSLGLAQLEISVIR